MNPKQTKRYNKDVCASFWFSLLRHCKHAGSSCITDGRHPLRKPQKHFEVTMASPELEESTNATIISSRFQIFFKIILLSWIGYSFSTLKSSASHKKLSRSSSEVTWSDNLKSYHVWAGRMICLANSIQNPTSDVVILVLTLCGLGPFPHSTKDPFTHV